MRRAEDTLQKQVVEFLAVALPADAESWFVPNGGNLSKAQRGVFKAMGLKPGIPDLHVLYRGRVHCIELKRPKERSPRTGKLIGGGKLSEDQKAMIARLRAAGAKVMVCWSVEQVEEALLGWNIPLKASVSARAAA